MSSMRETAPSGPPIASDTASSAVSSPRPSPSDASSIAVLTRWSFPAYVSAAVAACPPTRVESSAVMAFMSPEARIALSSGSLRRVRAVVLPRYAALSALAADSWSV